MASSWGVRSNHGTDRAACQAVVPLSALAAGLPGRHTASDRLQDIPRERSAELLAQFGAEPAALLALAGAEARTASVDNTDGLRVTSEDGEVVHLRPSGNAPELRCYSEAGSPLRARVLVDTALTALRSAQRT